MSRCNQHRHQCVRDVIAKGRGQRRNGPGRRRTKTERDTTRSVSHSFFLLISFVALSSPDCLLHPRVTPRSTDRRDSTKALGRPCLSLSLSLPVDDASWRSSQFSGCGSKPSAAGAPTSMAGQVDKPSRPSPELAGSCCCCCRFSDILACNLCDIAHQADVGPPRPLPACSIPRSFGQYRQD